MLCHKNLLFQIINWINFNRIKFKLTILNYRLLFNKQQSKERGKYNEKYSEKHFIWAFVLWVSEWVSDWYCVKKHIFIGNSIACAYIHTYIFPNHIQLALQRKCHGKWQSLIIMGHKMIHDADIARIQAQINRTVTLMNKKINCHVLLVDKRAWIFFLTFSSSP